MATCPSCGEENPDRFRLCGFCGTPLAPAAAPAEVRKTVTIVFSDLKGSTNLGEALDSESLREVMTRYFAEMRRVVEDHGGSVEKFIGDAVMAVFGLPKLHEDDALRAVRAAHDMQEALRALNEELERAWGVALESRIGVNTGEVVAGDPAVGQRLVTGDAVNVAARLEQAAPVGDVLLGDLTYRLVRDAVEVEPVEPLELKGKSKPVPAYRLVSVAHGEGYARRHDAPLVGRASELATLEAALAETAAERRARLVSVIADAGVGKSRLTEAFAAVAAGRAVARRGRCLPYGKGITFWPLVEISRDAAGIDDEDSPEVALAKLAALVPEPDRAAVVARVAAAIALADEQFPIEELFWGVRKLLEGLAREQPFVAVFDDVHWAEPMFLDLVEHLLDSVEAPLLIVCPSRPDLLERRESWALRAGASRVHLEPLSAAETELVVENLLGRVDIPAAARARIVDASEGNPLFAEQLLSMLIDAGHLQLDGGRWRSTGDLSDLPVPPTIHALLSARLDHLAADERAILEAAAVVGLVFPRAAVEELAPDSLQAGVADRLETLARKQLVRPHAGALEGGYRFNHILIRDAAYNGLLKRSRASLHERFVDWADRVNRDRDRAAEFEEILAYHLEQAYRYLGELGPLDDHGVELGRRAAERLASAGRRAFGRGDMSATASLLSRAVDLVPEDDPQRLALLPDLGEALIDTGDFDRSQEILDEAVARAGKAGDVRLEAEARLGRLLVRFFGGDLESWGDEVEREATRAIAIFEAAGDAAALAKAWRLLASVHGRACRFEEEAKAGRKAMVCARAAGDRRQELRSAAAYAMSTVYGRTPLSTALVECERVLDEADGDRRTTGLVLGSLAQLYALDGDFGRARDSYRRARVVLEDLGTNVLAASLSLDSHAVELLAGDPVAAERDLRRDYEALDLMGEKYLLSTIAGLLAGVLCEQERYDEANTMCMITASVASEDDAQSQALWRSVRGRVLARRDGEGDKAVALAREAVDVLRPTDALVWQGNAFVDYADTLAATGRRDEARHAVDEAVALYELKGSGVAANRARSLLDPLPV